MANGTAVEPIGRRHRVRDLVTMRASYGRGPVTAALAPQADLPDGVVVRLINISWLLPGE
jgi:hypothetical protein